MKSAINQLLVVLILITLSTVRANAQDAQRSGVTVSGYQTPGDQIGQNVMLSYENGSDYTVKVTAEVKYRCGEHTLTLSDTADYRTTSRRARPLSRGSITVRRRAWNSIKSESFPSKKNS
jgi:hypothetical protein